MVFAHAKDAGSQRYTGCMAGCRSLSTKEPPIIGLFCRKQSVKIWHLLCLDFVHVWCPSGTWDTKIEYMWENIYVYDVHSNKRYPALSIS